MFDVSASRTDDFEDEAADGPETLQPDELTLSLTVADPEVAAALLAEPAGRRRNNRALAALKIGVMALRQAQGQVDVERVRNEGDRLLASLSESLRAYREGVSSDLSTALKEYFDPQSGRFAERVERLVKQDGELETVVRQQVAGDGSALAHTLAAHLGPDSPIMQAVDPTSEKGLARRLADGAARAAAEEREKVLREFSLDNPDGALSRTVRELTTRHGAAGEALRAEVAAAVSEFSLDKENSALSRLVRRVDAAQRLISDEFSLDKEGSALARMRKEMNGQIDELARKNAAFQTEVMEKLTAMAARKAEADRGARHGDEFEAALFEFVQNIAQKHGDVAVATGRTTGLIRHNKKGDYVLELGPENAAPGARIVVEAKQDASYDLDKARRELAEARKNRDADIGLFVFSRRSAPTGQDPLLRLGDDVFAVWDWEDEASDIILQAAVSLARALAARARAAEGEAAADFGAMARAVREVEKQVKGLDEMATAAQTVVSGGERIQDRIRKM